MGQDVTRGKGATRIETKKVLWAGKRGEKEIDQLPRAGRRGGNKKATKNGLKPRLHHDLSKRRSRQ